MLLLENVAATALEIFARRGLPGRAPQDLAAARRAGAQQIADVHVLGIRSKTQVPAGGAGRRAAPAHARLLLHRHQPGRSRRAPTRTACRCSTRRSRNTRCVAELMIAEIIIAGAPARRSLARGARGQVAQGRRRLLGGARQDARHRRLRPHRPAARRARRDDRHARALLRSRRPSCRWATTRVAATLGELLEQRRLRVAARARDAGRRRT